MKQNKTDKAISSDEFVSRLAKSFDLLPCIKTILECEEGIALESLKDILEEKIVELNIRAWFEFYYDSLLS